jgi:hypothetical protein
MFLTFTFGMATKAFVTTYMFPNESRCNIDFEITLQQVGHSASGIFNRKKKIVQFVFFFHLLHCGCPMLKCMALQNLFVQLMFLTIT